MLLKLGKLLKTVSLIDKSPSKEGRYEPFSKITDVLNKGSTV